MYQPLQPGIATSKRDKVSYVEQLPSAKHSTLVASFWRLHSLEDLTDEFEYLVLPDGCIDIVFDLQSADATTGGLIMTPAIEAVRMHLARQFDYAGIRLRPGVWSGRPLDIVGTALDLPAIGPVDLVACRRQLQTGRQAVWEGLSSITDNLHTAGIIAPNHFVSHLVERIAGASVADVSVSAGYSRRQVQRILRERVGYRPHDLLKVIRFQQSLRYGGLDGFADQSHYIREFRRMTGMSPGQFAAEYGAMAEMSNTVRTTHGTVQT